MRRALRIPAPSQDWQASFRELASRPDDGPVRAMPGWPYQGEVVAANILAQPREASYQAIPAVVYPDPQAASVGAPEAAFTATVPVSEVAKAATYSRAPAEPGGFLTLLSDGEHLSGAYALGPQAGEWLQQATLAIRARVPLGVLRDVIQPFPTFSEIYVAALKALAGQVAAAR